MGIVIGPYTADDWSAMKAYKRSIEILDAKAKADGNYILYVLLEKQKSRYEEYRTRVA